MSERCSNESICCVQDCEKAASGTVYEHDDCTKYMMCDNGELVEQDCESGLAFNMKLQICDWADRNKCPQAFSKYD
jgi:Chitin binding Peritrophin-A domain